MQTKDKTGKNAKERITDLLNFFPDDLRNVLCRAVCSNADKLEEIRLRADRPLMLSYGMRDWYVEPDGCVVSKTDKPYLVNEEQIRRVLAQMCENSIYAYQEEIRNGYITLRGGHRVGIAGRVVFDGASVKNIKDISGLNIRIAREIEGCADKLLRFVTEGKNRVLNTLIVSPPQCGKTTILRDLARLLSNGDAGGTFGGVKVGIVDERSEIAACYRGSPQNNVGIRTDVLDGCPKALGMPMLLRSMSPDVIITDEIGNEGDCEAVLKVINAGVKIIASAHGYSISELKTRREVLKMMEEAVFDRYIVLSNTRGPGTVREIVDGRSMEVIFRGE